MSRSFAIALIMLGLSASGVAIATEVTAAVTDSWWQGIWNEPLGPLNLILVFLSTLIAGTGLYLGWRANETSHQQVRAYVLLEAARLEIRRPEPDANLIHVAMKLKNFGQTPAFDLSLASNGQFADAELNPPNFDGMTPVEKRNSRMIMGPGDELEFPPFAIKLTDEQTRALSKNRAWVYAWAVINYRDAFGAARRTTVFAKTEGEADGRWPVVPCKSGNEAT
jgi:hypothetical protein